jgi:hypothetical protein
MSRCAAAQLQRAHSLQLLSISLPHPHLAAVPFASLAEHYMRTLPSTYCHHGEAAGVAGAAGVGGVRVAATRCISGPHIQQSGLTCTASVNHNNIVNRCTAAPLQLPHSLQLLRVCLLHPHLAVVPVTSLTEHYMCTLPCTRCHYSETISFTGVAGGGGKSGAI